MAALGAASARRRGAPGFSILSTAIMRLSSLSTQWQWTGISPANAAGKVMRMRTRLGHTGPWLQWVSATA